MPLKKKRANQPDEQADAEELQKTIADQSDESSMDDDDDDDDDDEDGLEGTYDGNEVSKPPSSDLAMCGAWCSLI